jgi:3-oxoadipate enol-lactonase
VSPVGGGADAKNGEYMVPVDGTALHVVIEGKPGADWLAFSNSIATDLGVWSTVAPRLADHYRLLRYDTRGHGRSNPIDDAKAESMTFDRLAADVVGILDHFGIARTDFIGVSLGGITALGLGLTAPDRVRSLTVIGSRADMPPPMVQAWTDRIAAVRADGMESQVESTLARWFTAEFRANKPQLVAPIAAMIRTTSSNGFIAAANALRKLAYLPRLGSVRAPTLLLVGAQDEPTPAAMKAMAGALPDARFHQIDGAAHLVPVEQPAAVIAHLEAFLKSRR